MTRHDRLSEHLQRLVHVVRSVGLKRSLTAIDPRPRLNFWRLIYGNQLDIAVIEWCKVFGSDAEATHWKNIVPMDGHGRFRSDLLAYARLTPGAWARYWKEMKEYRDNLAAHHNSAVRIPNFPKLDVALDSSIFYYTYIIGELRQLGDGRFPDDLKEYSVEFELLARKVAVKAIASTQKFKESVG
jgi:hypothetical protein